MIGRCQVCALTIDGSAHDHMFTKHMDEAFEVWEDPETETWVILKRSDRIWVEE
jgi:hypothetical protein